MTDPSARRRSSDEAAITIDGAEDRVTPPADLAAAPIPARDEAPYRVSAIEHRTPAIADVWLRTLATPMDYRPGEYVLLEDRERQMPPRSYSIANAPRPDGLISLLVTRVHGGQTSVWVHDLLGVGDEVAVTGP